MNKPSLAYLDGWAAHYSGLSESQNPYDKNSQAKSYNEWMAGWHSRFDAIKHDLSLKLDEECF